MPKEDDSFLTIHPNEIIKLQYNLKIAKLHQENILKQIAIVRRMAIYRKNHGPAYQGFGYVIQMTESIMDQFNHDYSEDESDEQIS